MLESGTVELLTPSMIDIDTIQEILDDDRFKEALATTMDSIMGGSSSGSFSDFLSRYEGKKHVLATGGAGVGKTYEVDAFAKSSGRKIYFKSLDNGTEVIDLLGHLIKLPSGEFAWKDGVVTKAFREASKGNKVILFLDELLRAPERELSILIGALTPNSEGKLVLNTGRALLSTLDDGIVEEEVLEVELDNLWCVSSTNQGRNYHTGKIDRALSDRFRIFHKTLTEDELTAIVTSNLKKTDYAKSCSDSEIEVIVNQLKEFTKAVLSHVNGDGKLKIEVTARHLSEAVETANNKKDIKRRLLELLPNIVTFDSDGKPNTEQQELIKAYIMKFVRL
jgi:replication-associated recombination protein RarA